MTIDQPNLKRSTDDLEYPSLDDAPDVRPSVRVALALSEVTGVPPDSIDPLFETVDPDALDALVESDSLETIRFVHAGHEVVLDGDGQIGVRNV